MWKSGCVCHPNWFLFEIILAILVSLPLHRDFRNSLSISKGKAMLKLLSNALYMGLGRIDILTNTEVLNQKHDIYCSGILVLFDFFISVL